MLSYHFYRGLFKRKRISCNIVMPSAGDAIPNFENNELEPKRQYLVYEYEANGIRRLQYSRCRFSNANKYVNHKMVVYHNGCEKYDYLYIDVLRIHKIARMLLCCFGLVWGCIDVLYVIIMLLHSV